MSSRSRARARARNAVRLSSRVWHLRARAPALAASALAAASRPVALELLRSHRSFRSTADCSWSPKCCAVTPRLRESLRCPQRALRGESLLPMLPAPQPQPRQLGDKRRLSEDCLGALRILEEEPLHLPPIQEALRCGSGIDRLCEFRPWSRFMIRASSLAKRFYSSISF